jgi:hypothetical protein
MRSSLLPFRYLFWLKILSPKRGLERTKACRAGDWATLRPMDGCRAFVLCHRMSWPGVGLSRPQGIIHGAGMRHMRF